MKMRKKFFFKKKAMERESKPPKGPIQVTLLPATLEKLIVACTKRYQYLIYKIYGHHITYFVLFQELFIQRKRKVIILSLSLSLYL